PTRRPSDLGRAGGRHGAFAALNAAQQRLRLLVGEGLVGEVVEGHVAAQPCDRERVLEAELALRAGRRKAGAERPRAPRVHGRGGARRHPRGTRALRPGLAATGTPARLSPEPALPVAWAPGYATLGDPTAATSPPGSAHPPL